MANDFVIDVIVNKTAINKIDHEIYGESLRDGSCCGDTLLLQPRCQSQEFVAGALPNILQADLAKVHPSESGKG